MDVRREIAEIEPRLAACGLSVAAVCRLAALSQTSWVRWKNGTPARAATWLRVRTAVDAALRDAKSGEAA